MFRPTCPLAFFKCFMSNAGAHTEPEIEPIIKSTGVDCFNSVNDDQIYMFQVIKFIKLQPPNFETLSYICEFVFIIFFFIVLLGVSCVLKCLRI